MADSETVTILKAELERLQKLEADLPGLLEKVRNETTKERLEHLHTKQRENPEKHREQSKKRYELKKAEILAKRREAYQRKKAAKTGEVSSGASEESPGPS